jgi:putative cardiolipin synthase
VSPSHVAALPDPAEGLLARLALIRDAESTLDVQYYLWDSDAAGYLLLSRILEAADRGVFARLLVDDMKFRRRTRRIASLCLHPNLEVRLFNPWSRRSSAVSQGLEFIRRFASLNRRMHNKLLVADRKRAVFGGRNVADEHYGLGTRFNLVDFDLLLDGAEASELSDAFDAYWTSPFAVAGATLDESVSEADLETVRVFVAEELAARTPTLAKVLAQEDDWGELAEGHTVNLASGSVTIAFDAPGEASLTQVIEALRAAVTNAKRDLVVVTPFFVPSDADVRWYGRLVERGVRIRILTNSLASNEGTISNSGLNRERLALLKAGVELHELRTDASAKPDWETPPRVARYLGLHAKLYVIDRASVFLGSVNLDPRSKFINTEIGVHVRNAELAAVAADAIVELMKPENAWRVVIGSDGRLRWRNDRETLRRQPARNWGQQAADKLLTVIPIRDYI